MSATILLMRRFAADYARNGANLLVLVAVPGTFVLVAAGTLSDAAQVLGGASSAVATVTAGWAAGFVSAIGTYFLVAGNRVPDRRLVASGLPRTVLIGARIGTALLVAAVASATALLALAARTGIDDAAAAITGTAMFALIYTAIGALAGVLFRDPVNGTVAILFAWILDVFFGPALTGTERQATRLLPTHYVSLWMTGQDSGHSARLENLAWSVGWMGLALAASAWLLSASTRQSTASRHPLGCRPNPHAHQATANVVVEPLRPVRNRGGQAAAAVTWALRHWLRLRVLWFLLIAVPAVFVLLSDAITPPGRMVVTVRDAGHEATIVVDPAALHAGTMAPSGIAALAMLAAVFIALDTDRADGRLMQAGMTRGAVVIARLATVAAAAMAATGASLAMAALVFEPASWGGYAGASILVAITYGLIGVLLAPVIGRVGAVLLSFLIPFLDLGLTQTPMLRAEPADWARALPGYGSMRTLVDAAVTPSFDQWFALAAGLTWIALLLALLVARVGRPGRGRWPTTAS